MRAALVAALAIACAGACAARDAPVTPATDDGGWFELGPDRPQLGFDTPFELVATPASATAARGELTWRQVSGPSVIWRAEERGWRLVVRTPTLAAARPGPLPAGIVSFSPATRGEVVFEATWRGAEHAEVRRSVRLAATARATGIPTVGLGHAVVLAGAGWRLAEKPRGARATLTSGPDFATLIPDATGRWALIDAAGAELALRSGRADEMQLDCARSGCHASAGHGVVGSPMTNALARVFDGARGGARDGARGGARDGADDPRCTIACHAAGEPGLEDGGFAHVAGELGVTLPTRGAPGAWAKLPRALRRVGGVGCIACHGPAAVPEPGARWSVLRSDVCAVCHDAPPRYAIVAEWRAGRMARADALPGTRDEPCARCHTTAGFLAALGVRPVGANGTPPPDVGPVGIACAACHAAHGDRIGRALIRRVPVPPDAAALFSAVSPPGGAVPVAAPSPGGAVPVAAPSAGGAVPVAAPSAGGAVPLAVDAPSAICLPCHAQPASTVSLLAATGGLVVATGAPLLGESAHLAVPDLCLGCHAGHAFAPALARCSTATCHPTGAPPELGRDVRTRAVALAERLGLTHAGAPPHALSFPVDDTPLGRARANVRLVLDDAAAGAHNAAYARRLLDEAEAALR
ncbi:MAG: hypothetical protein EXR73_10705 [Myxococcales bacterium]|nr:hypothetical protein [Myxococcales bacterium]